MNIYFSSGIVNLDIYTNTVSYDSIKAFPRYLKAMNNFIADNNVLYLAMAEGMWRYDLKLHQLDSIVYKDGSSNSQSAAFYNVCKSDDKIYFAGKFGKGGPFMFDKSTHIIKDLSLITTKNNETNIYCYCLSFNDHILYAGINTGDSIYAYNETTGKKNVMPVPMSYTNGKPGGILSLCVDKKQNLWCATINNGIFVLNIPTQKWIRHISQEDGYFPVSSTKLICDEDGIVWCNSSEGLYSFNTGNFHFKNYTLNDGLLSESNGGDLVLLPGHRLAYNNLKADSIAFGIINTRPVDNSIDTISVSITDLKVLGNLFLADTLLDNVQQVILPPNQNAFSLSYAGVTINAGKSLLYSYMLEGAEKHWHEAGNEQSLSYVNLTPGKYILHIKCKSRDERIISRERLLYITMLPAWYQAWWFKVIVILVLSGMVFLAIRYYLSEQIKKQQAKLEKERSLTEERNRIAADMHDDVGAGLSRIRYITASMKDKQAINIDDIEKIVSLSDESVEKMNEIIWSLNQGNQPLDELLYYTRSQCSEMVNNAGLAFSFELPENIPQKILAWKDCRNIYLLVKESVNNAIKHAGATLITIECSIAGQLQFSITDNGKGFDPAEVTKSGNGLLNYKKRVEKLKGTYQLITALGAGTKIIFSIPIEPVQVL
jgi:signal transduction histidine kinase